MSRPGDYPWYASVSGRDLQQGDVFERCPTFFPKTITAAGVPKEVAFDFAERRAIVITQSCDLVEGREKCTALALCPVFDLEEFDRGYLATPRGREDVRRGIVPGSHMLAACDLEGLRHGVRIVDFRQLVTMPVDYMREFATATGPRLRLLPPYREHLAQAFARYFMRVGLPADIPPFRP